MLAEGAERGLLLKGLVTAMRLSLEPMVLSDPHQPDNPIIAVNKAFQELTRYPEHELTGRNCRFLQGPATDRTAVRQLGACVRRGEGCVQFLINYRRDSTQFYNLLFVTPVHGQDGQLHFFFANQHNLSAAPPLDLAEFPIGPAHMSPGQQTEFRLLLLDIATSAVLATASDTLPDRVQALEASLAAAREIATLSTRLQPGAPTGPLAGKDG